MHEPVHKDEAEAKLHILAEGDEIVYRVGGV
jgi:hypothetical protein